MTNNRPTFRDIRQRAVTLTPTPKIIFLVPHTNEFPAVRPLLVDLYEILTKRDKKIETNVTEDMQNRISKSADRIPHDVSDKELILIEKLFRLEDLWLRLKKIAGLLNKYRDATVVEIHALDKDYNEGDYFLMADFFCRLPDTRILVLQDFTMEFIIPMSWGLEAVSKALEIKDKADLKRYATILGCFEGLSGTEIAQIKNSYSNVMNVLSQNINRFALIEVPAPSEYTIRLTGNPVIDRPILKYFYNISHKPTRFEMFYLYSISKETHLTENDLRAILNMFSVTNI